MISSAIQVFSPPLAVTYVVARAVTTSITLPDLTGYMYKGSLVTPPLYMYLVAVNQGLVSGREGRARALPDTHP